MAGEEEDTSSARNLIATTNGTGFDMGIPTYKIEEWVAAYDGDKPLYDVGSGYGTNTMVALGKGCRVVAVDMEEEHLAHIRKRAGEGAVASGSLKTLFGQLPDIDQLPEQGASGILCAQVLHFLRPEAVKECFHNFFRWLKPGGRLVTLACSHYIKLVSIEQLQALEVSSSDNEEWTGFQIYENSDTLKEHVPEPYRGSVTAYFRTFSCDQLRGAVESAGFAVESCKYAAGVLSGYPPWIINSNCPEERYRDKEMVAIIATRPKE